MADVLTREQRRLNMSRIRGRDTRPEMIVRRLVHGFGLRYRLHHRDLPGKPDLVLSRHRKVVLVHGCFWHRHSCRFGQVRPATNSAFWQKKISGNVERDRRNEAALQSSGWTVITVWECETKDPVALERRLAAALIDGR